MTRSRHGRRVKDRPEIKAKGQPAMRGLREVDVEKFYAAINAICERRRGPVVKIR